MKTIPKPEHGSLAWQQVRHRDPDGKCIIGASEVSVVMGDNPYETPADLAIRKLSPPQVTETNDAMMRGNVLEPSLLQYAINELDESFYLPDEMYANGRVIATLDGRSRTNSQLLLEAKTNNRFALGSELPLGWWWQAQAQMFCTGADEVVFVILDKHLRLGFDRVVRAPEMINFMQEQVEEFCSYIDQDRMPPLLPLTASQVGLLYPTPTGETDLGSDAIALIAEWGAIKTAINDLEQQEKAVKDALAMRMLDADFGCVDGQRVLSFKSQKSSRLDQKALLAEHPELGDKYISTTSFRVMRTIR